MDRLGEGGLVHGGKWIDWGRGRLVHGGKWIDWGRGRLVHGGKWIDWGRGRLVDVWRGVLVDVWRGRLEVLSHPPIHGWCYVGSRVHLHRAAQINCTSLHVT